VGFGTTLFWWYIALIFALVLLGGVFSGLTLGLMGLDTVSQTLKGVGAGADG
jgi:metal transporter CNNM